MVARTWQIEVLLFGTSCNFFFNISDPWLVESVDARPEKTEGQLYSWTVGCNSSGDGESLIGIGSKDNGRGPSLVAQGLRIRLPMQGTRVRALVQEDPTCRGATKPVRHNY